MRSPLPLAIALALLTTPALADTIEACPAPRPLAAPVDTFRLDLGLTFDRFEQQVKAEIGGARGERLVEESHLGLALHATARVWGPLSLGLFGRLDTGARRAGRFTGLDDAGRAVVVDETGGDFTELWTGPLARAEWRMLFVEVGYGALGRRWDDARADLAAITGDTDAALRTSPTVAWLAALGARLTVAEGLDAVVRLEYRVRYYDRRDDALADALVHGTQDFTPFVGVAWRP